MEKTEIILISKSEILIDRSICTPSLLTKDTEGYRMRSILYP